MNSSQTHPKYKSLKTLERSFHSHCIISCENLIKPINRIHENIISYYTTRHLKCCSIHGFCTYLSIFSMAQGSAYISNYNLKFSPHLVEVCLQDHSYRIHQRFCPWIKWNQNVFSRMFYFISNNLIEGMC